MFFRFKVSAILTLIAFIIVFFVKSWENNTRFPEEGIVTYEQLDEIIELAEDRSRQYDLILDDIILKVKEIKRDMRTAWELQNEENYEKEQEHYAEQIW
jgi:hypothetical protein